MPSFARIAAASSPVIDAVVSTSRSVRSAVTGTVSTSSRRATSKRTSTFMPGRSSRSSFSSEISTGNSVTFCSTTACGSIFSIVPAKRFPGYDGDGDARRHARRDLAEVGLVDADARLHRGKGRPWS